MLKTLGAYISREAWPRKGEICSGGEFWFAAAAGALTGWFAPHLASDTSLGDALAIVLAYAAIAFGFSVAGLTVALTLPDGEFVRELATLEPTGDKLRGLKRRPNAYGDLLFVYSWTAILHWLVIALSFALVIAFGFDHRLGGRRIGEPTRAIDGLLVFLLTYAAIQFLYTVITLSQVGHHYIAKLRRSSKAA
jgi:hypothetical protein